jgi:hypothetical protein
MDANPGLFQNKKETKILHVRICLVPSAEAYSYLNASAGRILAADHEG